MARVPYVERENLSGEARQLYNTFLRARCSYVSLEYDGAEPKCVAGRVGAVGEVVVRM